MLYKAGGQHFHMLGTNGFHVKAETERFIAVSSHCGQGPVSRKSRKFAGDKNLFVSSIGTRFVL